MADKSEKPPKLVKRRDHKNSNFRAGRTIGEKREKLETKRERTVARKKDKQKKAARVIFTLIGFLTLAAVLVALFVGFSNKQQAEPLTIIDESPSDPTIDIVDEDAKNGGQVTARMREYIGQVEMDLRELEIKPTKAIIPTGTIRQVNFYIDGYKGYIKTLIDRPAGVTAEDISRMLKYLKSKEIKDFEYIDVRIEGKAYWK